MRRVLLIVLSLIPVLALGQPVYDCHRAEGKIKIDGKLKEKAWEAAVPCTEFGDIRGKGHAAPKYLTTMRMLWDYENIYISAVLEEPDVKALVKDHDDIVYHDNDFEVFLNPFCDEKLYYELETNALGTVMDLLMEKPYRKGGTYI
ncbi:MAG: carbohydrate-binding family 9-like protein, partial [Bacteroidales bacterium]|nr:carbohydrate-binding family 9-like protein [Bacteroidales bacterium]